MGATPIMTTMNKEEQLTEYKGDLDLELRHGIKVTMKISKFKCHKQVHPGFGCGYFRKEDYWNHVAYLVKRW